MRPAVPALVFALGAASCSDAGRWMPLPGVPDFEAPLVPSARLASLDDGGLAIEVEAADPGGCGIARVSVGLFGDAFAAGSLLASLDPAGGQAWRRVIDADRCGDAGEAAFADVSVLDRAGNWKVFGKVWQEPRLQATDGHGELAVIPIPLGATRTAPRLLDLRLEAEAGGPVVLTAGHDAPRCGYGGHARAKGPDGTVAWFIHRPELATSTSETWTLDDTRCLADGAWTIDEVLLQADGGGGAFVWADLDDAEYSDGLPVVRFEVAQGRGEGLPFRLAGVSLEPDSLAVGWPATVSVAVETAPGACPPAIVLGKLRRLPSEDGVQRALPVGDGALVEVSPCTPPGRWWLDDLFVQDASGVRWRFDLPYGEPEAGFYQAPGVTPASLRLE